VTESANSSITPKYAVMALMKATLPERQHEITFLWKKYNIDIAIVSDTKHVPLNANGATIVFDFKIIDVFCLMSFATWKVIERYSPHVVSSAKIMKKIARLIEVDPGIDETERFYKEQRAAAQALLDARTSVAFWHPEPQRLTMDYNRLCITPNQIAFDLARIALVFAVFHEFRHIMLEHDNLQPNDSWEEELICDAWARDFMTERVTQYANATGQHYQEVLRKRLMGLALAALVLDEITPIWGHGVNRPYLLVEDRLQPILDNSPLSEDDRFWVFTASLLLGVFRQRAIPIDAAPSSAYALTYYLLSKLSMSS
jgi:hypothetical protein